MHRQGKVALPYTGDADACVLASLCGHARHRAEFFWNWIGSILCLPRGDLPRRFGSMTFASTLFERYFYSGVETESLCEEIMYLGYDALFVMTIRSFKERLVRFNMDA